MARFTSRGSIVLSLPAAHNPADALHQNRVYGRTPFQLGSTNSMRACRSSRSKMWFFTAGSRSRRNPSYTLSHWPGLSAHSDTNSKSRPYPRRTQARPEVTRKGHARRPRRRSLSHPAGRGSTRRWPGPRCAGRIGWPPRSSSAPPTPCDRSPDRGPTGRDG